MHEESKVLMQGVGGLQHGDAAMGDSFCSAVAGGQSASGPTDGGQGAPADEDLEMIAWPEDGSSISGG